MKSKGHLRWVNVFLAASGAFVSFVLLAMGGGSALSRAVCTPTAAVNCDYVLASPQARVGPLPTSALGVAYFLSLGTWYLFVGTPNAAGRRWRLVPIAVNAAGLLGSVYYVYVMAALLPVWCTWCIAAHVINALLMIGALLNRPAPQSPDAAAAPYPTRARAAAVIFATGGCTIVFAMFVFAYQMQLTARRFQLDYLSAVNNPDYIQWRWLANPRHDIPLRSDERIFGNEDAPHLLVAFTDFECAKCEWFHRYSRHLLEIMSHRLRIVFLDCPMSAACNDRVTDDFHLYSCDAARAAEAARLTGSLDMYHRYMGRLFANRAHFHRRPYAALAAATGYDPKRFADALASEDSATGVQEDLALARELGVEGTPTLFLDGRELPAWFIWTDDVKPRIDVTATDDLWRFLLSVERSTENSSRDLPAR